MSDELTDSFEPVESFESVESFEPVEVVEVPDDDTPAPSRWELPDSTGVPAVDDALAPLVELDELPTGEHVPYFETVHRRLQDALADLDSA